MCKTFIEYDTERRIDGLSRGIQVRVYCKLLTGHDGYHLFEPRFELVQEQEQEQETGETEDGS